MTAIEVGGLVKRFGDVSALAGLDLQVGSGEFAVVLGSSGSGKTTLLRLVAGLDSPDAGQIRFDGRDVTDLDPSQRNIAMVFQQDGLLPHLNVQENLAFPLRMRRDSTRDVKRRVAETVDLLNLSPLLDRHPDELSGGQRQRVALGRALVRQPVAFLMDEPLSHLDTPLRTMVRELLRRLHEQVKITTILVTHDQTEAMALADRLIVLDHGKCVQSGDPLDVYDHPSTPLVGAFLGNPPMNLIRARCDNSKDALVANVRIPIFGAPPAGENVLMGIRPESIRLDGQASLAIPAIVRAVARLGFDSVVDLELDRDTVIQARVAARVTLEPGYSLTISFEAADVRWFPSDGENT